MTNKIKINKNSWIYILSNYLYGLRTNVVFKNKLLNGIVTVFRTLLLFFLSFILLYPLLYALSIAFRPYQQLLDPLVVWIPKSLTLDNIKTVIELIDYPKALVNTTIMALLCAAFQTCACAVTGYGFSRFKFKGREFLFLLVLFTIIVPPQTYTIPLYFNYRRFDFFGIGKIIGFITGETVSANLVDTFWPIFLPVIFGNGIRSGLFIYVFRQFFRNMPMELEDAAYIDGCNPFKAFIRVMVPNAGPAFLVTFLFSMVWYWNDYYFVSMFLNKTKVLAVELSGLSGSIYTRIAKGGTDWYIQNYALMQSGCLLYILPMLILYIFLQKYFTESIQRTGIVG